MVKTQKIATGKKVKKTISPGSQQKGRVKKVTPRTDEAHFQKSTFLGNGKMGREDRTAIEKRKKR